MLVEKRTRGGGASIVSLVDGGVLAVGTALRFHYKHVNVSARVGDDGRIVCDEPAEACGIYERPCAFVRACLSATNESVNILPARLLNGYAAVEAAVKDNDDDDDKATTTWTPLATLRAKMRAQQRNDDNDNDDGEDSDGNNKVRKKIRRVRRTKLIEHELDDAYQELVAGAPARVQAPVRTSVAAASIRAMERRRRDTVIARILDQWIVREKINHVIA